MPQETTCAAPRDTKVTSNSSHTESSQPVNEVQIEPCSETSLNAGEPLLGSAPQVTVWILIEYQSPWKERALENNSLASEVRSWLASELRSFIEMGELPRLQFIRSVNRESNAGPLSLFVYNGGSLRRLQFESYGDLLGTSLKSCSLESMRENHYFVCTNGMRDLCCARLGMPAWNELQKWVGDRAWQTSHLGGHRMAPNVLTLPAGFLCGRVYSCQVDEFVEMIEAGSLPLQWLRGRSAYPSEAQACEAILGKPTLGIKSASCSRVEFCMHEGLVASVDIPVRESIQVRASCRSKETEERQIFVTGDEKFPCEAA